MEIEKGQIFSLLRVLLIVLKNLILKLIFIFLFIQNCISLPKNIEKVKTEECSYAFNKLQKNYLKFRGIQIAVIQNSFWGLVFYGPVGGIIFLSPVAILEYVGYGEDRKIKKRYWGEYNCEE